MFKPVSIWQLLLPLLVALVAAAAYLPGLHGGFLFDDFANLPALGATGRVDNWPTFWRYITSGIADPTGRPLTLLSFLIDARDWPADPLPFKRTNLILHIINGALLFALLAKLGYLLDSDKPRSRVAALVGATLWLLHPLLVSTTLYIVQREAMLPATCVMSGLLIWLHGRSQLAAGKTVAGVLWSILGLGGFTLFGVLAKANGVLLPLYALLIEIIVLAPRQTMGTERSRRSHRAFMGMFAILPALLIVVSIVWIGLHGIISGGPEARTWSYAQRLLTEPRVLMDYLALLWLPRPLSSGLFNDQYLASTSLLQPVTTLPAILALLALIVGAWKLRQLRPSLALSVLFYLAGQLLESTSIPLELYFEHRNYVPAMLMFWPLGRWLVNMSSLKTLKKILITALPIGLALMTHARAEVWGNVQLQALVWARINPNSMRAQANAAQIDMQNGRLRQAIDRLQVSLVKQPTQAQIAFNLIGARCMSGGIGSGDLIAARTVMSGTGYAGTLFISWFDRMLPLVASGGCPGLTTKDLLDLINVGLRNVRLSAAGPQQDLIYLRGRIALTQHEPDAALSDFIRALDLQVRPGLALESAATLGAAGYPTRGLMLLDHYTKLKNQTVPSGAGMPMLHDWVLARQHYWPNELTHLRDQLKVDAEIEGANAQQSILTPSIPR